MNGYFIQKYPYYFKLVFFASFLSSIVRQYQQNLWLLFVSHSIIDWVKNKSLHVIGPYLFHKIYGNIFVDFRPAIKLIVETSLRSTHVGSNFFNFSHFFKQDFSRLVEGKKLFMKVSIIFSS